MCGVIGVAGLTESSKEAFLGLITLQHRGQDAAGILTYDSNSADFPLKIFKNSGLVERVFSRENVEALTGAFAIGHNRYATTGKGSLAEIQPLITNFPYGISIAHNGNIVNYLELKDYLRNQLRVQCLTHSDSETILHWIAQHLTGTSFDAIAQAVLSVFEHAVGSYSVVGMISGAGMIAFRDPNGLKPLMLGKKTTPEGATAYMVASESAPLAFLGYSFMRDIEPGELVFIDESFRLHTRILKKNAKRNSCMFEWVYFAGAESAIENAPVYSVRYELGKSLARQMLNSSSEIAEQAQIVVPVPDTARPAANAISEMLKIPYRDVLIKNRYITRTFILGTNAKRSDAVDLKLHPIRHEIEGKVVLLVDDSIVRGTTSKKLVKLIREAGAKKVYFISTCPPVKHPCFYGIDFPDSKELIAAGCRSDNVQDYVAKAIGADGVVYLDNSALTSAIAKHTDGKVKTPCMACLTGSYPTDINASSRFAEKRINHRQDETRLEGLRL